MVEIKKKWLLIVILFVFTILSFKTYEQYVNIKKVNTQVIFQKAVVISTFIDSYINVYEKTFQENHIPFNDTTIKLFPTQNIKKISESFSTQFNQNILIKLVSDRPRNKENLANSFEMDMIKYFRDNPNQKIVFKEKNDEYFYFRPLIVTKSCLKCHGKKELAPLSIQKKYSTAYNYKVGQIRGILDIEIKEQMNFKTLYKDIIINTIIAIIVFIIATIILYKLVTQIKQEVDKNQKTQEMMFSQSRMAQMGEMISMIAHQWRQPLSAISSRSLDLDIKIEMEYFDFTTPQGRDEAQKYFTTSLKGIDELVQNLTTTIDDFRNFYKPNKKAIQISLDKVVQEAMKIIKTSLENDNIKIVYLYKNIEIVEVYDRELMQVVLNILKNAQDNFKIKNIKDKVLTISISQKKLSICDNGGGIDAKILEHIFDPYFSTKSEKNGTGLGLYMSKIIVRDHHKGKLEAKNMNGGICFIIDLNGGGN